MVGYNRHEVLKVLSHAAHGQNLRAVSEFWLNPAHEGRMPCGDYDLHLVRPVTITDSEGNPWIIEKVWMFTDGETGVAVVAGLPNKPFGESCDVAKEVRNYAPDSNGHEWVRGIALGVVRFDEPEMFDRLNAFLAPFGVRIDEHAPVEPERVRES